MVSAGKQLSQGKMSRSVICPQKSEQFLSIVQNSWCPMVPCASSNICRTTFWISGNCNTCRGSMELRARAKESFASCQGVSKQYRYPETAPFVKWRVMILWDTSIVTIIPKYHTSVAPECFAISRSALPAQPRIIFSVDENWLRTLSATPQRPLQPQAATSLASTASLHMRKHVERLSVRWFLWSGLKKIFVLASKDLVLRANWRNVHQSCWSCEPLLLL